MIRHGLPVHPPEPEGPRLLDKIFSESVETALSAELRFHYSKSHFCKLGIPVMKHQRAMSDNLLVPADRSRGMDVTGTIQFSESFGVVNVLVTVGVPIGLVHTLRHLNGFRGLHCTYRAFAWLTARGFSGLHDIVPVQLACLIVVGDALVFQVLDQDRLVPLGAEVVQ